MHGFCIFCWAFVFCEKATMFQQEEVRRKTIWIEGTVLRKPKGKGNELLGRIQVMYFSYIIRCDLESHGVQ